MSDERDDFKIEPQPVYAREETGSKLFGWTIPELVTMLGVVIVAAVFFGSAKLTIGAGFATYIYLKKLKDKLPPRFFASIISYYTRDDFLYRSNGRDVEWRPPIVREKND